MKRLLSVVGLACTLAYFWFCWVVFGDRLERIRALDLNEAGDFLAGVFGPVAFLWLVLGYFQQGIELSQNTKALELQVSELANSVEQQKQLVAATREQIAHERDQARQKALPRFILRTLSVNPSKAGLPAWYTLTLANEGGTCTDVHFSFQPPIERPQIRGRTWMTGQAVDIEFSFHFDDGGKAKPMTMSIDFIDSMDEKGTRHFLLLESKVPPAVRMQPLSTACNP